MIVNSKSKVLNSKKRLQIGNLINQRFMVC